MATNALPAEVQAFLETLDRVSADQLKKALRMKAKRGASDAELDMAVIDAAVVKHGKNGAGGPKRSLNSWMAFRNYYNSALKQFPQKVRSKVMTKWWAAELFQAKWVILAKAYSIVRGTREKEDAPLDEFFAICAPLIGVIPPDVYQLWMGWKVILPADGNTDETPQIIRIFIPVPDDFADKFTMTTLSVEDLVKHCYAVGYISDMPKITGAPHESDHDSLTMASKPAGTAASSTEPTETSDEPASNTAPPPPAFYDAFVRELITNLNNKLPTDASPLTTARDAFEQALMLNLQDELTAADAELSEMQDSEPEHSWSEPAGNAERTMLFAMADRDHIYPDEDDAASAFANPHTTFDPSEPDAAVADRGLWDAFDMEIIADICDTTAALLEAGTTAFRVPVSDHLLQDPKLVFVLKNCLMGKFDRRFEVAVEAGTNLVEVDLVETMPSLSSVSEHMPSIATDESKSKRKESEIPRPANAWVLFRKDQHARVMAENPGITNCEASVVIGQEWSMVPEDVKIEYQARAAEVKRLHALRHPGYKYRPRKASERKRRQTKTKQAKYAPSPVVSPLETFERNLQVLLNGELTGDANDPHAPTSLDVMIEAVSGDDTSSAARARHLTSLGEQDRQITLDDDALDAMTEFNFSDILHDGYASVMPQA